MRISLSLSLIALAACAPAQDPPSPTPAAKSATPAALAPPVRMVVTADDGFQLTMWRKAPADVAAALRAIGDRPVLLGWSLGSMVAQLTSQHHPEAVGALVLVGYPFDPDGKVPERPEPDAPARKPTTAEAAAEDFIAPGAISKRAIA